jgi:reductive dehalogenase
MAKAAPGVPTERVDERDTMFARAERVPGTPAYAATYARRPELQAVDDELRALPPLLEPGGAFYDERVTAEAGALFRAIDALAVDEAWVRAKLDAFADAPDASRFLKASALDLGAVAAGWARLHPAFVYSHKGRFAEDHGTPVELDHPFVLVFLVEMDRHEMRAAPRAPTLRESARQYYRAARVSLHLEALMRRLGYAAKHHYDAHYDVILPPLAVAAGLGEVGRSNILIADRCGARVRIGAVTTSFPAVPDRPRSLGVDAFCAVCRKCADNCPGRALAAGGRSEVRGVAKWPTDVERCYRYWRRVGTDCGVCMACCPFSHADNALHNLVRRVVRRAPWAHRALVWGDELVYGRRWRGRQPPPAPSQSL